MQQGGRRRWQAFAQRAAIAFLAVNFVASAPSALAAESFGGVPRIVDGDTLVVSCLHVA